jgi:hypothetical protein
VLPGCREDVAVPGAIDHDLTSDCLQSRFAVTDDMGDRPAPNEGLTGPGVEAQVDAGLGEKLIGSMPKLFWVVGHVVPDCVRTSSPYQPQRRYRSTKPSSILPRSSDAG